MKSFFVLGLFAAISVAQVTRADNGLTTTTQDEETSHASTAASGASTSVSALQYPAYSGAETTESPEATSWTVYPSGSATDGAWTTLETSVTSAGYAAPTEASNATSSTYSFGGYSSTKTTGSSTSATSAGSTSTPSEFTGAAAGKEIVLGFGAAAAALALFI